CKRLFQLTYYNADEIDDNSLIAIFSDHPELNKPFDKIFIGYDYPQSMLIPGPFYRDGEPEVLLKTMYGTSKSSVVISEIIEGRQLYNSYAVPKKMQEWMSRKFPAAKYFHHYTCLMKNITAAGESGKLSIDFREKDFSIIAAKENKLLLAQTFLYSTPEDVVYYLLRICRQFSLSQMEVQISLSGLIEKQSALYRELYQYFIHLEFRNAGWAIAGADEYPAHFFASLNDLTQCGS
ncbi:MAG TPA: DUF3822 family protein, partial [Chitinophagaceae bacterium]|nr:DUF3822 family protein [Chitinophagaceae bacterium]